MIVTRSNNLHPCKSDASALLSAKKSRGVFFILLFNGKWLSLTVAKQKVLTAMHRLVKPITASAFFSLIRHMLEAS